MSTMCHQIDSLAKTLLITAPHYPNLSDIYEVDCSDTLFLAELRDRVMDIIFDCLPNWGIDGLRDPKDITKQNWFFLDPKSADKAMLRYHCLDHGQLLAVISSALQDILGIESAVLGIGIYGSYLYGHFDDFRDIDVIVIAETTTDVALDAIRYRDRRLAQVFLAPCHLKFSTNELGMTIIGRSALNRRNHSFIVTEAALLDTTITLSSGLCINAPPLTPFLMTLNARKLVKWAISELLSNPIKTINLIDQALRLRTMMYLQFPSFRFQSDGILRFTWPSLMEQVTNTTYLLEKCHELMNLIMGDENTIRRAVYASL
jgi:predicted nucleotidyltransferase